MNVADERTRSIWMDTRVADASELSANAHADVVVIGSGIAGLSTAYELATRGLSVIVVDRGDIGSGMTARTTAHLVSALDDFYAELIKARDLATARTLYQSLAASIDRAEEIQAAENIDCDFRRLDGYLFLAPETSPSDLEDELEACRKLGIPAKDHRERIPLQIDGVHGAIRFPAQARFHPMKYLRGLAQAVQRRGGRLFANTCVTKVSEKDGAVSVETASGHTLTANSVVVATNSPVIDRVAIHTEQAPYRTFVIAGTLPRGSLPDALYWDTLEAYHYVRLQPLSDTEDAVIIGGEDYKSGEANDGERRFRALEEWARARIPALGQITHRWSGQVLEPADYVGFIGKNPGNEHVYIVSGDSGQGITNGIVAGILLSDLITEGQSPWCELYDPGRKVTGSLGEYVSENLTPLKNFAEYVTAGELSSAQQLKAGEGGLYRSGLKKLAVCKDLDGTVHVRSATCTHMGCVVHWNSTEQCWDCPCHGSQFAPDGTALNGPAIAALADEEDRADAV
jgi:glycine/D-amino acid oxidase-like deaminating enzyme/nitrite reductase/ring-hydroxylating ferredoxin subunit